MTECTCQIVAINSANPTKQQIKDYDITNPIEIELPLDKMTIETYKGIGHILYKMNLKIKIPNK